jgi:hypothetical protein
MTDQKDICRLINSPLGGAGQPIVFSDSGYKVEDLTLFQRYKFNIYSIYLYKVYI